MLFPVRARLKPTQPQGSLTNTIAKWGLDTGPVAWGKNYLNSEGKGFKQRFAIANVAHNPWGFFVWSCLPFPLLTARSGVRKEGFEGSSCAGGGCILVQREPDTTRQEQVLPSYHVKKSSEDAAMKKKNSPSDSTLI